MRFKVTRVKINSAGAKAILTSGEVAADLASRAEAVASACNGASTWGGYHASSSTSGTRARAWVRSSDRRNDEARDNRMIHNLDAGA